MLHCLRELTLRHCLPQLTAVVTNVRSWNFLTYSAVNEVKLMAKKQIEQRLPNPGDARAASAFQLNMGSNPSLYEITRQPLDIFKDAKIEKSCLESICNVVTFLAAQNYKLPSQFICT